MLRSPNDSAAAETGFSKDPLFYSFVYALLALDWSLVENAQYDELIPVDVTDKDICSYSRRVMSVTEQLFKLSHFRDPDHDVLLPKLQSMMLQMTSYIHRFHLHTTPAGSALCAKIDNFCYSMVKILFQIDNSGIAGNWKNHTHDRMLTCARSIDLLLYSSNLCIRYGDAALLAPPLNLNTSCYPRRTFARFYKYLTTSSADVPDCCRSFSNIWIWKSLQARKFTLAAGRGHLEDGVFRLSDFRSSGCKTIPEFTVWDADLNAPVRKHLYFNLKKLATALQQHMLFKPPIIIRRPIADVILLEQLRGLFETSMEHLANWFSAYDGGDEELKRVLADDNPGDLSDVFQKAVQGTIPCGKSKNHSVRSRKYDFARSPGKDVKDLYAVKTFDSPLMGLRALTLGTRIDEHGNEFVRLTSHDLVIHSRSLLGPTIACSLIFGRSALFEKILVGDSLTLARSLYEMEISFNDFLDGAKFHDDCLETDPVDLTVPWKRHLYDSILLSSQILAKLKDVTATGSYFSSYPALNLIAGGVPLLASMVFFEELDKRSFNYRLELCWRWTNIQCIPSVFKTASTLADLEIPLPPVDLSSSARDLDKACMVDLLALGRLNFETKLSGDLPQFIEMNERNHRYDYLHQRYSNLFDQPKHQCGRSLRSFQNLHDLCSDCLKTQPIRLWYQNNCRYHPRHLGRLHQQLALKGVPISFEDAFCSNGPLSLNQHVRFIFTADGAFRFNQFERRSRGSRAQKERYIAVKNCQSPANSSLLSLATFSLGKLLEAYAGNASFRVAILSLHSQMLRLSVMVGRMHELRLNLDIESPISLQDFYSDYETYSNVSLSGHQRDHPILAIFSAVRNFGSFVPSDSSLIGTLERRYSTLCYDKLGVLITRLAPALDWKIDGEFLSWNYICSKLECLNDFLRFPGRSQC